MSALDLLLFAAVLIGMSVQAAIGFGFAFFVAPAAFAAFEPEPAVTLVLLLGIAINCLVLFGERRSAEVESRQVGLLLVAAAPGTLAGLWLLTHADRSLLQIAVGVIVLAGAAIQAIAGSQPSAGVERRGGGSAAIEVTGGFAAGALTTSVSVNGPVLVLVLTRLGLRGARLRDSLAAALLGLSVLATPVVLAGVGSGRALPEAWVLLGCVPVLLIGHRFGAALFRRLDDATHHRAALAAAAVAGLLSIGAAIV